MGRTARNRAETAFAIGCVAVGFAILAALGSTVACASKHEGPSPVLGGSVPATSATAQAETAPLDFILDPLDKDADPRPESEVLRGKRAIVLLVTTYDFGSLVALRNLAPLLRELPPDTQCLLVALQPLGDRMIISSYFDAEKTPCRRAIGDPARGRLGDLAKVKVVPTVIVLRADGSLAGGAAHTIEEKPVRELLAKAK